MAAASYYQDVRFRYSCTDQQYFITCSASGSLSKKMNEDGFVLENWGKEKEAETKVEVVTDPEFDVAVATVS